MIPFEHIVNVQFGLPRSGRELYVLAVNGLLNRADGVDTQSQPEIDAFLAGETLATGYTDETQTTRIVQPLLSDPEGRYTSDSDGNVFSAAFFGEDDYHLYSPDDTVHPIVLWNAAAGWHFADDGLQLGRRRPLPGPTGPHICLPGLHYEEDATGMHVGHRASAEEMSDPAELIGRRTCGKGGPGWPIHIDDEEWWPTSPLAADVAPGANEFYVANGRNFAVSIGTLGTGVEFCVGDQKPITYTFKVTAAADLCGPHDAGATELLVDRTDLIPPAPGILWSARPRMYVYYEAIENHLTTSTVGQYRAGDNTIELASVAGLPAEGGFRVVTVAGTVVSAHYSTIVGNVLTLRSPIHRNVDAGSAVTVEKLTGVTSREGLPMEDDDHNPTFYPDGGNPLPPDERKAREAVVHSGIFNALKAGSELGVHKMTGAAGFVGGASRGDEVIYDPPHKPVTPANVTTLLVHGQGYGPGGHNRQAQIGFNTAEDAWDQQHHGGRMTFTCTAVGGSAARITKMVLMDSFAGILGGGIRDHTQLAFPWHVAAWGARVKSAGELAPGEEPPEEPDPDIPPDPGQVGSPTILVTHTSGALPAARITVNVHNRLLGQNEDIDIDYAGLGSDGKSLTGCVKVGSGTLADYFLPSGAFIRYAASQKYIAGAFKGQVAASQGIAAETRMGNIGPTAADPEPGISMGLTNPLDLFRRSDGKVGAKHTATGETTLATEAYADLLVQGVKWKETARAATTVATPLSDERTIDGVALVTGDRVLVKDQASSSGNGLYIVAVGAWSRTLDADTGEELEAATVAVAEGTVNGNTTWRQTTDSITLGVSDILWTELAGITVAGDGAVRVGNTLNVGEGTGISVTDDAVSADPSGFNLSGTHAARPAAGTAGRTYFETDRRLPYLDTGAAWIPTGVGRVIKSADQILTPSSTTLQNITDLAFPIDVGEEFWIEAILRLGTASGGATADWKFGWTGPTGFIAGWGTIGDPTALVQGGMWHAVGTTATPGNNRTITETLSIGAVGGGSHGAILIGRFRAPTNAGTVQLQVAQDTAQALNSTIQIGSMLRLTPLA